MSRSGEFDWISKYLAPLASSDSFYLKDDAAILAVDDGYELVVSQDAILEQVHFLSDDPLDLVARKAIRVNVSDLIAKGAIPFAYSMALGVPDAWEDRHMEQFTNGLVEDQSTYNLKLTGGDTYRSPDRLCVSITMFAKVLRGKYKSRLTANPGDILAVSGAIGSSAIGLKVATGQLIVRESEKPQHLDCYRLPDPPLAISSVIANYATASMDISDGLLGDCRKLCSASGVSAELSRPDVPLAPHIVSLLDTDPGLWREVLTGGDDYQVLFAAKTSSWRDIVANSEVPITQIGRLTKGENSLVSIDMEGLGVSLERDSFSHF